MFSKIKRYLQDKFFQDKFFDKYIPLNKAIKELYKLEKELLPGRVPVGGPWTWKPHEEYKIVREYYLFNRMLQYHLYGMRLILSKQPYKKLVKTELPCWTISDPTGLSETKFHASYSWRGNNIVIHKYQKHEPSYFQPGSMYMADINKTKRTHEVIICDVSIKRSRIRKIIDVIKQEAVESPTTEERKQDLKQIRKNRKRKRRLCRSEALIASGINKLFKKRNAKLKSYDWGKPCH